jgi:hypothetical protein
VSKVVSKPTGSRGKYFENIDSHVGSSACENSTQPSQFVPHIQDTSSHFLSPNRYSVLEHFRTQVNFETQTTDSVPMGGKDHSTGGQFDNFNCYSVLQHHLPRATKSGSTEAIKGYYLTSQVL